MSYCASYDAIFDDSAVSVPLEMYGVFQALFQVRPSEDR